MIVAGDIILQGSAFVSQRDFLCCEVYCLSGAQSGTLKRNCWGSSEFSLMSDCSSTLTSVTLPREFIGCKACNMAAQGTRQMSRWIQWVSAWFAWYFRLLFGFSDYSSLSEELGFLGRDRIHLMSREILHLLTGFLAYWEGLWNKVTRGLWWIHLTHSHTLDWID